MREAVIVSYARTGLAKSGRGGFNITPPMSIAAHAIKHAVERAEVDGRRIGQPFLLLGTADHRDGGQLDPLGRRRLHRGRRR